MEFPFIHIKYKIIRHFAAHNAATSSSAPLSTSNLTVHLNLVFIYFFLYLRVSPRKAANKSNKIVMTEVWKKFHDDISHVSRALIMFSILLFMTRLTAITYNLYSPLCSSSRSKDLGAYRSCSVGAKCHFYSFLANKKFIRCYRLAASSRGKVTTE